MSEDQTSWRDGFPEQFRDAPFIAKAESPEDALQQLQNAAAWMGNSVRVPGPDAGDSDRSAFRAKIMEKDSGLMVKPDPSSDEANAEIYRSLGRPEDADGYSAFDGLENAPTGDALGRMRAAALESNLTAKQFEQFVGKMLGHEAETALANQQAAKDAAAALRGEWGPAYDQRVADARKAAELSGASEAEIALLSGEAANADRLRMWHNVAQRLGAEGVNGGKTNDGSERPLSTHECQERVAEINRLIHDRTANITMERRRSLNEERVRLIGIMAAN